LENVFHCNVKPHDQKVLSAIKQNNRIGLGRDIAPHHAYRWHDKTLSLFALLARLVWEGSLGWIISKWSRQPPWSNWPATRICFNRNP